MDKMILKSKCRKFSFLIQTSHICTSHKHTRKQRLAKQYDFSYKLKSKKSDHELSSYIYYSYRKKEIQNSLKRTIFALFTLKSKSVFITSYTAEIKWNFQNPLFFPKFSNISTSPHFETIRTGVHRLFLVHPVYPVHN